MFGLEKKSPEKFAFDLEKDLKSHPHKKKELLGKLTEKIQELKNLLREGSTGEEFDYLSLLLNGYTALQKVLTKINT
ncbi:MAG: DUF5398 family protein [Chlamydiae bacterium]|nr:DUF5398 family protein [Chlamydiota bacterium]